MRDVSPIDGNQGRVPIATHGGSHIPVLRKAAPAVRIGEAPTAQKFWDGKVAPNNKVLWDDYSGEPTASNGGRASSVSPGSYAKLAASSSRKPMGYQVSIRGPDKRNSSLTERVSRFGSRSPPNEVAKYEPWSRATGRSEIAPPLKYKPATKPLQVQRKSLSPTAERFSRMGPGAMALAVDRLPVAAETVPVAENTRPVATREDSIKPTPPLKVGKTTPPRIFASPASPIYPTGLGIQALYPYSPTTPTQKEQPQSPDTVIHEDGLARQLPAQQRVSTPPQDRAVSESPEQTPEKDKEAPTSRFSWTTYNSATTYQHSPPPSPPPAMPTTTPQRLRVVTEPISAASAASSILSRRRPVPPSDRDTGTMSSRKSIDADSSGTAKIQRLSFPNSPISPSAASIFSTATTGTSKALPAPPSALTAADHIAVLESQMEDLRIRRNNVYRLLNDLNNAAPANPLITDFKRARLADQRKRAFEDDLAEIKIEEHDVGMRLHRAWKKREREDPGQAGSAIWVRRVTS